MFRNNFFNLHKRLLIQLKLLDLNTFKYYSGVAKPKIKKFQNLEKNVAENKQRSITSDLTYLQVLGCGGFGSSKAVYLSTPNSSYLFNCSEGTQRSFCELEIKTARLNNIFVTTPVWSNMGGLLGLAKYIEDESLTELFLHGPNGTINLLESSKLFTTYQYLQIKNPTLHMGENNLMTYSDDWIQVEYVPLLRKQTYMNSPIFPKKLLVGEVDIDNSIQSYGSKNSIKVAKKTKTVESVGRNNLTMAYICKLRKSCNAIDINKCFDLGITSVFMLKRLMNNLDVALPNGKIICYEDVCIEQVNEPVFIVIDCYDENVLKSLITNKHFDRFFHNSNQNNNKTPCCIIHFTPERFLQNERYNKWMSNFGTSTQHLIINDHNKSLNSISVFELQHQLHYLHPTIFPLLADNKNVFDESCERENLEGGFKIIRAKNADTFTLQPLEGFRRSLDEMYVEDRMIAMNQVIGFPEYYKKFKSKLINKIKTLGTIEEYPKLTMLGTASGIANHVRNVSGILLQIDKHSSMLLDCGENTISQMKRLFGMKRYHEILSTIKLIFVSHFHADHHFGLLELIQERTKMNLEPIELLIPKILKLWLHYYNHNFEEVLKYVTLTLNTEIKNNQNLSLKRKIFEKFHIKELLTEETYHCPDSHAISITLNDDRKIIYSGDTKPCEKLIEFGQNCDLLIHEATCQDDNLSKAIALKHSTISQAIKVGNDMKAKYILLTHFGSINDYIPHVIEEEVNLKNVGLAFDNMQIQLSELPLLPMFNRIMSIMFDDHMECEELIDLKRKMLMFEDKE